MGVEKSALHPFQAASARLVEWLNRHPLPEPAIIILTSVVVGVGAGFGAVVFRWLIATIKRLAFEGVGEMVGFPAPPALILIPAAGGLLFGPLIYFFAREAKGHGVPEVMEAVALRGGRIRPRVAVVKSLASSLCIGTGGSVGREGPIVQIGSALGSTVGQLLDLSDDRIRSLVACGAAGGIAATFNAPIAGALFALEIILGQFQATYFGAVVISAVTSDVIAQLFLGEERAFLVPPYSLVSPWELLLYALLGVLSAFVAVGFSRLLYVAEDLFDAWHFPEYLKPVIGGALLGLLGLLAPRLGGGFPRIFGVGYDSISDALFGRLAMTTALLLLVLKLLATSLTLGSGGSGGVFAPSLFMGAMLGQTFGTVVHRLFPQVTAPPGGYALVGMASVFAGAAHAPITAIIILFEMTGDYNIILPLMFGTVVSTLISRGLSYESIYTLKLVRRGVHLRQGQDIDVMQAVTVGEAMSTQVDTVPPDMSLQELARAFTETHHHGFPVTDEEGNLLGIVSIRDLEEAMARGPIDGLTVADIATMDNLVVAYPHEPMWVALRRLGSRDLSRLPVLEAEGSRKLVGVVRRSDIIRAYNAAILARAQQQHRVEQLRLGRLDGVRFMEFDVAPGAPVAGKALRDLKLPENCLVVSVRRGRKLYVAQAHTVLLPGDHVTIFAPDECSPELARLLTGRPGLSVSESEEEKEAVLEEAPEGERESAREPSGEVGT